VSLGGWVLNVPDIWKDKGYSFLLFDEEITGITKEQWFEIRDDEIDPD
jgi:hypothetical protein